MKNNIPNLFIVGAAKAGTTSLYSYLSKHPDVFMSTIKEPHYFSKDIRCKDFTKKNSVNVCFNIKKYLSFKELEIKHISFIEDENDYLQLFRDVKKEKVIGETSTGYLFSNVAAENIYKFNKDAKIVIILRDPVQRAYSHWKMNLAACIEDIETSFLDAIKEDFKLPNKGYYQSHLYVELGQYAQQIKRYKKIFKSENIKIMRFEDLSTDLNTFMSEIYDFLGLNALIHSKDSKKNVSTMIRMNWLREIHSSIGISKFIPKKMKVLLKKHLTSTEFPKVSQEDYFYIYINYFKEEIAELEQLLNIDLSQWKYEKMKNEK